MQAFLKELAIIFFVGRKQLDFYRFAASKFFDILKEAVVTKDDWERRVWEGEVKIDQLLAFKEDAVFRFSILEQTVIARDGLSLLVRLDDFRLKH